MTSSGEASPTPVTAEKYALAAKAATAAVSTPLYVSYRRMRALILKRVFAFEELATLFRNCGHLINGDFNATIKYRSTGKRWRFKKLMGNTIRTVTAAATTSPAVATPRSAASYKTTWNSFRAQFSVHLRTRINVVLLPRENL